MEDESADLLGNPTMPVVRGDHSGRWAQLTFTVKSAFVLALLLVLYITGVQLWDYVLRWRERSYKLGIRRKHGIPDDDHRPFNVAYADVLQTRRENEAAKRKPKPTRPAPSAVDRVNAPPEQQVRQRTGAQSSTPFIPGTYNSFNGAYALTPANDITYSSQSATNYQDITNPYSVQPSRTEFIPDINTSSQKAGPSRRAWRKSLNGNIDGRKRGIDEYDSEEHDTKKTKVEGDGLVDADEDAEWQDQNGQPPKRGSKRVLGEEDDHEDFQSKHIRDKRARKVSLEKAPQTIDNEMDVYEETDEVPDMKASSRGKKRDRAEAGSTFGGDDEDSTPEEEDLKARRRRRKRQTVSRRKSDLASLARGKKRDRDAEDVESDIESEDEMMHKISRKKRGKRGSIAPQSVVDDGSDISVDESLASSRSRGRRIGDEWESNGVKYKIGPNAQRLRQTLVKKARQKFVMPEDSRHPDRNANLEVYVETWLTEEEYQEAKAQSLLAWQDSPKASVEPERLSVDTATAQQTGTPQVQGGKNLLWGSTNATPAASPISSVNDSPVPAKPSAVVPGRVQYRQVSGGVGQVGLRINPFEQTRPQGLTRRIAHTVNPLNNSLLDSTNANPRVYKTFSKLEKQELEAKAMLSIRAKQAEQEAKRKAEQERAEQEKALKERLERDRAERERAEKEKAERVKAEKEHKEKEAAAAAAKPPAISFPKPAEAQSVQDHAKAATPSFSFPPPPQPAKAPEVSKPSFFNAPPISSTPSFPPAAPKVADKPPSTFLAPSTATLPQPPAPAPPSASAASSQNRPTFSFATSQPTSNPFAKSATSNTSEQATPSVPFPTTSNAPATQSKPLFTFPPPPQQKKETPSLLAQHGAPNPHPTTPEQQKSSAPGTSFSFPPKVDTSKANPFNTASSTNKMSFNLNPAGSSAPQSSSLSSSLSGALGPDASKATSGPSFSFKGSTAPAAPAPLTSEGNKDAAGGSLKFSFAAPSSGSEPTKTSEPAKPAEPTKLAFSGFGGPNAFSTTTQSGLLNTFGSASSASSPFGGSNASGAPNAFGGSNTSSTPNVFGSSNTPSTSNAFGASNTSNVFGGSKTSSIFGGGANTNGTKPDEQKLSGAFAFGGSTSATTPVANAGNEAPKLAFASMGTQPSTTPTTTPSVTSPFTFNVGGGSTAPKTAFGTSTLFGQTSGPSAFGFSNPSSANGTNVFSTASNTSQQPQQQQQ